MYQGGAVSALYFLGVRGRLIGGLSGLFPRSRPFAPCAFAKLLEPMAQFCSSPNPR